MPSNKEIEAAAYAIDADLRVSRPIALRALTAAEQVRANEKRSANRPKDSLDSDADDSCGGID